MHDQLRIYMFGGLRIEHAGVERTKFRTRKTASLLAYLAYHSESPTSREVLIDQFWPEDPPEKARASLNTAVSSVRAVLGAPQSLAYAFLNADRDTVSLNKDLLWTDVAEFRVLARKARCRGRIRRTH